jgi:hypothetical protein
VGRWACIKMPFNITKHLNLLNTLTVPIRRNRSVLHKGKKDSQGTPVSFSISFVYSYKFDGMKQKVPNDRKITIYEPLLFGSIAIIGGLVYIIIKALS